MTLEQKTRFYQMLPNKLLYSREVKSLRHVAIIAKFLDANKPKTSFKKWIRTVSNFIDLIQFLFYLSNNVGEILGGLNLKGPYLSLKNEKENFCVVFTYSIKQAREISNFHVAVVQRRQRNVEKSLMHVQSCCFANIYLLLFCCSRCWRQTSPLYWINLLCKERKSCLFYYETKFPKDTFPRTMEHE